MEFNPLIQTEQIKNRYKEFLLTTFTSTNDVFRREIDPLFTDGFVWTDSFISLSNKYRSGPELRELGSLDIDPRLIASFKLGRLYLHQYDAIKRIIESNNTIVSTGTGSGKTESFLLPVLDFCIKNKKTGVKGTKAIIVYPMKALANDQANRLRNLLTQLNTEFGSEPITFGVYDADTPENEDDIKTKRKDLIEKYEVIEQGNQQVLTKKDKSELITRQEMRQTPPDILITNYVQLEYLLIRKKDLPLLSGHTIKFVIFDEIHAYRGAQGIDVAFLIRRLKQKLISQKEPPVFIGTSATISSKKDDRSRKDEIAHFCSRLFGAEFRSENVITATTEKMEFDKSTTYPERGISPIQIVDSISDAVIDQLRIKDLELDESLSNEKKLAILLLKNKFFEKLCLALKTPKGTEKLIEVLSSDTEIKKYFENKDKSFVFDTLWTYLKLGSKAEVEITKEKEPLIRVNIHNFFKIPDGVYRCTNPDCGKVHKKEIEKCKCGSKAVMPLASCRNCGAPFTILQTPPESREDLNKAPLRNALSKSPNPKLKALGESKGYFIKRRVYNPYFRENRLTNVLLSPSTAIDSDFAICLECGGASSGNPTACLNAACRSTKLVRMINSVVRNGKPYQNKCPNCGYRARGWGAFAITHLRISPQNARHILFEQVFLALPEEKRKLLVFIDGIQECSKFAVGLEETHRAEIVKNLIYNELKKHQEDEGELWMQIKELRDRIQNGHFDPWYSMFPDQDVKSDIEFEVAKLILIEASGVRRVSLKKFGLIHRSFRGLESLEKFSKELQKDAEFSSFVEMNKLDCERIRVALHFLVDDMANKLAFRSSVESGMPLEYGELFSGFDTGPTRTRTVTMGEKRYGDNAKIYNFLYQKNLDRISKLLPPEQVENFVRKGVEFLKRRGVIQFIPITASERVSKPIYALVLNDSRVLLSSAREVPRDVLNNYYAQYYVHQKPIRMVVQTDTSKISTVKRKRIEADFRKPTADRSIDVVVATPTLELGVDIGDLLSVGLVKAPPSPAAYIQRVGRAGRVDRISFNNTFFHPNNIDMFYFERPGELINGDISPPTVDTSNLHLLKRHIYAMILQYMFTVSNWSKKYEETDCFEWVKHIEIRKNFTDAILSEKDNLLNHCLGFLDQLPEVKPLISKDMISELISTLPNEITMAFQEYAQRDGELSKSITINQKQMEKERDKFLRARLQKRFGILFSKQNDHRDKRVLTLFQEMDLLPRYAFSYRAISLFDGIDETSGGEASASIVEYCPGVQIHLNKRRYDSVGLDISRVHKDSIYICGKCHSFANSVRFDVCKLCAATASAEEIAIAIPKRIFIRLSRQRKIIEKNHPEHYTLVSPDYTHPGSSVDFGGITVQHFKEGLVYTVVNGLNVNKAIREIKKMKFCSDCGYLQLDEEKQKHHIPTTYHWCNGTRFEEFLPTTILETSILCLDFQTIPQISSEDSLITLKNAIINAANSIIGCEDGEIGGVVAGNKIFLFDNLDGGAGFTESVLENLKEIFLRANEIVNNPTDHCHSACLDCLVSYRRRGDIPSLNKKLVAPYLQSVSNRIIRNELTQSELINESVLAEVGDDSVIKSFKKELLGKQIYQVISQPEKTDGAEQLKALLYGAQNEILITSLYIDDKSIPWNDGSFESFEDILLNIKNRRPDIKITVILRPPTDLNHKEVAKRLKEAGIIIKTYAKPITDLERRRGIIHEKMIAIDPDDTSFSIVIQTSANLSDEVYRNKDTWFFILDPTIIKQNVEAFREVERGAVDFES